MEATAISYYRVSTNKQSLGLDAQKEMVDKYTKDRYDVIAEYSEKESGKNNSRPALLKALEHCKESNSVLIVANLSRLSRNLTFLSQLMDANISFICCDMPQANSLTLNLMAVLAQQERMWISERTSLALAELKKKGVKLGSPQNLTMVATLKAAEANKKKAATNTNNIKAKKVVNLLKAQGKTLWQIAHELNTDGFLTSTGKKFKAEQVRRLLKINTPQLC